MKWWQYGLCILCIVVGVFSAINLYRVFTAETRTYGTVKFEKEEIVEVISVKYDIVTLFPTSTPNVYDLQDSLASVDFDGTKHDYEVLLNGYPCKVNQVGAGFVYSTFDLTFYDIEGEIAAQMELKIKFEFFTADTKFSMTTTNTNDAISYFYQMVEANGLRIEVVYKQIIKEVL